MKCSQCRVKQDGLVGHTGNILFIYLLFFIFFIFDKLLNV